MVAKTWVSAICPRASFLVAVYARVGIAPHKLSFIALIGQSIGCTGCRMTSAVGGGTRRLCVVAFTYSGRSLFNDGLRRMQNAIGFAEQEGDQSGRRPVERASEDHPKHFSDTTPRLISPASTPPPTCAAFLPSAKADC